MNFNDVFEEYLELYTEGKEKGLDGKACWDGYELRGTKKKDGKTVDNCVKSDEEENSEDNEVAKQIGKGALKLAGKGALKAAKELGHFVTDDNFRGKRSDEEVEDCESCGCSDEEVEDCETCGCEENPEYGHFNDTYSNYIDQYEAEDAEYDMGEVLDAIADDFANDMTKSELEAKYGTDAVRKFIIYGDEDGKHHEEDAEYDIGEVFDTISDDIKAGMTMDELVDEHGAEYVRMFDEYLAVSKRDRPTNRTNPRPHVNRKVVKNIKNTPGPDPIEDEDAEGKIDKDRMKCNKPRRTSGGSKKFVVKACKDGKEKVVRFGDPNMKIKKSNPKRRKSFRARHKCDQKKDKFKASYWSCRKW